MKTFSQLLRSDVIARQLAWFGKVFLFLLVLSSLPVTALSEIIPAERRITWQGNVGIPGGIPTYTTIYTNLTGIDKTGALDVSAAIQNALNACPARQVVKLPAGIFRLENTISLTKGNVLRGEGTNTILRIALPSSLYYCVKIGTDLGGDDAWNIASTALKGATNVILASASNLAVGNVVTIEQLNDDVLVSNNPRAGESKSQDMWYGTTRNLAQFIEITGVSGTSVSFWPPLNWTWTNSLNAQLHRKGSGQFVQGCGIEDLCVEQTSANGNANLSINFAKYCWIKNVESRNCYKYHCWLISAFRCEVRDSYFHDAQGSTSTGNYGISCANASAFNLMENNIINNCIAALILAEMCQGNVFGYNYSHNVQYTPANWQQADLTSHDCHPMMNLFEGNFGHLMCGDYIHGSSSHNTIFRNLLLGSQPGTDTQNRGVMIDEWNRYWNVVGNVLGSTRTPWGYEATGPGDIDISSNVIWQLGFSSQPFLHSYVFMDAVVPQTTLRHGNYDYAKRQITWDAGVADHVIPASLYLTAKPSWFGDRPWPPFDPENPGAAVATNLPAGYKFFYGINTNQAPAPPAIVLATPASGDNYLAPADISIAAGVTANGYVINKVQFFNGSTLLGESSVAPYTFMWNLVGVGTYALKARAIYNTSNSVDSSAATVTVSLTNSLPVVTLTSPVGGANFTAPAAVNLAASAVLSGHTINAVRFYNGTALLGEATSAPYEMLWSAVAAGSYTLTARAVYDTGSTVDSISVVMTVTNAGAASVQSAGSIGVGQYLTDRFAAQKFTAQSTLTTATVSCRLSRNGVPNFNVSCVLYSHNPTNSTPLTPIGTESAPIAANTLPDVATDIVFSNVVASITNAGTYWIVLKTTATSNPNYVNWFYSSSAYDANHSLMNSADGGAWSVTASSLAGIFSLAKAAPIIPPTIELVTPLGNTNFLAPATISLAASVNPNGHTIAKVQFFDGSLLLGESLGEPYSFTWNLVGAGAHSLKARVIYDGSNIVDSSVATVTVTLPLPAPVVTLAAPLSGASFVAPASVSLAASVVTNGHAITAVQFYSGSTLLGQSSVVPYGSLWSGVAAGSYSITARAVYDTGSTVDSPPVAITVTNPAQVAQIQSTGSVGVGQYLSDQYVAQKFTSPATYTTASITCRLSRNGAPPFNISCAIYSHNPTNSTPLALLGSESDPVVASSISDTAVDLLFANVKAPLQSGGTYWIVIKSSSTANPNYVNWHYIPSTHDASHSIMNSANGEVWSETAASLKGIYSLLFQPNAPSNLRVIQKP